MFVALLQSYFIFSLHFVLQPARDILLDTVDQSQLLRSTFPTPLIRNACRRAQVVERHGRPKQRDQGGDGTDGAALYSACCRRLAHGVMSAKSPRGPAAGLQTNVLLSVLLPSMPQLGKLRARRNRMRTLYCPLRRGYCLR